jgi:hypothetical protein
LVLLQRNNRTVASNSPYTFLACCGTTVPLLAQTVFTRLGCIVDKIIILIIKFGLREGKKGAKRRPKAEAGPQHSSYTTETHKASALR